jgi:hypothetical protein
MVTDATGEPAMTDAQRIVIVDLRIPFFRLVMFFIKAGLAVIPGCDHRGISADAGDSPGRRHPRRPQLCHKALDVLKAPVGALGAEAPSGA